MSPQKQSFKSILKISSWSEGILLFSSSEHVSIELYRYLTCNTLELRHLSMLSISSFLERELERWKLSIEWVGNYYSHTCFPYHKVPQKRLSVFCLHWFLFYFHISICSPPFALELWSLRESSRCSHQLSYLLCWIHFALHHVGHLVFRIHYTRLVHLLRPFSWH